MTETLKIVSWNVRNTHYDFGSVPTTKVTNLREHLPRPHLAFDYIIKCIIKWEADVVFLIEAPKQAIALTFYLENDYLNRREKEMNLGKESNWYVFDSSTSENNKVTNLHESYIILCRKDLWKDYEEAMSKIKSFGPQFHEINMGSERKPDKKLLEIRKSVFFEMNFSNFKMGLCCLHAPPPKSLNTKYRIEILNQYFQSLEQVFLKENYDCILFFGDLNLQEDEGDNHKSNPKNPLKLEKFTLAAEQPKVTVYGINEVWKGENPKDTSTYDRFYICINSSKRDKIKYPSLGYEVLDLVKEFLPIQNAINIAKEKISNAVESLIENQKKINPDAIDEEYDTNRLTAEFRQSRKNIEKYYSGDEFRNRFDKLNTIYESHEKRNQLIQKNKNLKTSSNNRDSKKNLAAFKQSLVEAENINQKLNSLSMFFNPILMPKCTYSDSISDHAPISLTLNISYESLKIQQQQMNPSTFK